MNVALGAALIAKDVYGDLDVSALAHRLDDLARPLEGGALAGLPLAKQAEEVSARFRELGFRGNVGDYYDAKNSLLPDARRSRSAGIALHLDIHELARADLTRVLELDPRRPSSPSGSRSFARPRGPPQTRPDKRKTPRQRFRADEA